MLLLPPFLLTWSTLPFPFPYPMFLLLPSIMPIYPWPYTVSLVSVAYVSLVASLTITVSSLYSYVVPLPIMSPVLVSRPEVLDTPEIIHTYLSPEGACYLGQG